MIPTSTPTTDEHAGDRVTFESSPDEDIGKNAHAAVAANFFQLRLGGQRVSILHPNDLFRR